MRIRTRLARLATPPRLAALAGILAVCGSLAVPVYAKGGVKPPVTAPPPITAPPVTPPPVTPLPPDPLPVPVPLPPPPGGRTVVWQAREPIGGAFGFPTSGACVGVLPDRFTPTDRIHVVYGESTFGDVRTNWIFNPLVFSGAWTSGLDGLLPARSQFNQGVVLGGKLFCMGGKSTLSFFTGL